LVGWNISTCLKRVFDPTEHLLDIKDPLVTELLKVESVGYVEVGAVGRLACETLHGNGLDEPVSLWIVLFSERFWISICTKFANEDDESRIDECRIGTCPVK
jgi:hypothetical protein